MTSHGGGSHGVSSTLFESTPPNLIFTYYIRVVEAVVVEAMVAAACA
jgi:hypothetical protein